MKDIINPFDMLDMDKAADRIKEAIEKHEKIVIYGDYDVDGITSTTLLYDFLSEQGADVSYYIPDRKDEGYGINIMAVNRLLKQGAKLLITVDCGITAIGEVEFASLSAGFVLVMYITACFSALSVIRYVTEAGMFNLGMVFIGAWISDIFAYFTGRLLGKHKLIPEVSPKKTVEGSVGAIVFTTLLMLLYGWIVSLATDFEPNYLVLGLSAPVLSVVGQVGDLFASLVKRERGVKDYGKLLPGHGGIMARFDSILTVSGATMVITLLFTPFA